MKNIWMKILKGIIGIGCFGLLLIFGGSWYVKASQEDSILLKRNLKRAKNIDCIVVLGCYVHKDGTMSYMLRDRMNRAIELYKEGVSSKILVSGDHGTTGYDEVYTMRKYAMEQGVPSKDIFMDHAGFSTYETMYRAKSVFGVKRCVVVTQKYHMYRALYDAKQQGIKAYGVSAKEVNYKGQTYRDIREVAARGKDIWMCLFDVKPKYLGNKIPISGDGNVTKG